MAAEPQSQPWPKDFKAHIMRVIEAIIDPDQVTDKAYVDALFALVSGALVYQGTWDASTNTPALADSTGTKGHYYAVTVAGTQDLGSGNITFTTNDRVIHNGTIWQKWDTEDEVKSIFGRVGVVVSTAGDYTASQVTNVPAGSIVAITVQAAINELDTKKVNLTLFDANTILKADSDDNPTALVVAEQTLVGRITSGVITALNAAQIRTLLGLPNPIDNKAGIVVSGSFIGIPRKATIAFATVMPSANYAIAISSEASRNFVIESKTVNGFVINTGSAAVLVGNTFWIARLVNNP